MSVMFWEGALSEPLKSDGSRHSLKAVAGEESAAPNRPTAEVRAPWSDGPAPVSERVAPIPQSTPELAPLAMPAQDLRHAPPTYRMHFPDVTARRVLMLAGSGGLAAIAGAIMIDVLGADGVSVVEGLLIALTVLLSAWIGFSFLSVFAGFVLALAGHGAPLRPSPRPARGRTAILTLTYNEDPGLIQSNVQAMAEDLRRVGAGGGYEIFILSDTREAHIADAEVASFLRLRARLGEGAPNIHYRRRAHNTDRKAGNIADWVQAFGDSYDYMLILDADSLMSADCILGLTAAMEDDPQLGLLQTAPAIVNAETPFARLQQFANHLYGPVFALGQHWWSASEGNYWGHNAIIRVTAFAESAGLPHLSGPRPFGGHILSHDFIEAALLRRRGWAVRMAAGLPGSYETTPPNLLDLAARDRRWCQGNLQHVRLLAAAGLHWVSRLHLVRGVLAYVAPVLWLAQLVCGAVVWSVERQAGAAAHGKVVALFALMVALLAGPKLMAFVLAMRDRRIRAGFGGARRLAWGFVLESLVSVLTTPVMMMMQTAAVGQVLMGRDSGWAAQRRDGVELAPRQVWRAHRSHVALGVTGAIAALLVDPNFLVWTSPVFLGLTLSAFLNLHTSRAPLSVGRAGLLQIVEEVRPPPVLSRAQELRRAYDDAAELRRHIEALFIAPPAIHRFETVAAPRGRGRLAA